MIARTILHFILLVLLSSVAISAEKTSWTTEEIADDFLKRGLLTKEQHALLRSNEFLDSDCKSDKHSSCKPRINFVGGQCGLTGSVDIIDEKGKYTPGYTTLTWDISQLGLRVEQYPAALKAFNKWNASAEAAWTELKDVHSKAVAIANSGAKRVDKLKQAKPLLERAEKISEAMARAAGFEYDGGCGAGEEDSQIVRFSFPEKPKSALYILQMEFDACKRVLSDPYDTKACEAWMNIQSSNELSGLYRYRVVWSDGGISEKPFSALSKGKKTVEVSR